VKTAVELLWVCVGSVAFLLSLYALKELGVSPTVQACAAIVIGVLAWVTWHTHWKR
jgi:hypothetical protein